MRMVWGTRHLSICLSLILTVHLSLSYPSRIPNYRRATSDEVTSSKHKARASLDPTFNTNDVPPNTLIVRQDTTNETEFSTIQAAVNALRDLTGPQYIYIHNGTYHEQVYIDYDEPLTIWGNATKTLSGRSNHVTIAFNLSAALAKSNQASATLNVVKDDCAIYNLNIVNTFGNGTDTQALAVNAQGKRIAFYNTYFSSFQDTLRAYRGVQYYSDCYITGGVDFIFSRDVMAWWETPAIAIKKGSKEPITASGRRSNDTTGFLVINRANVFSAGALPQSAYLGRPWHDGANVAFMRSNLSDVIHPDGWLAWSPPLDPRTNGTTFQEYKNYGPGSKGERKFGSPLELPHRPEDILGSDYKSWVHQDHLPNVDDIEQ